MTIALIYALVAMGVHETTDSFWKGTIWPYYVGKVIGQAVNAQ
ncbi:hypothetical protein [Rhizobium leguminosarum]|nr:hypothetical protein [Rhizobium leguminosarum]